MLTRILTGTARIAAAPQQAPQRFASSASSQLAAFCLARTGNQFSEVHAGQWQYPRFKAETGSTVYSSLKVFGQ